MFVCSGGLNRLFNCFYRAYSSSCSCCTAIIYCVASIMHMSHSLCCVDKVLVCVLRYICVCEAASKNLAGKIKVFFCMKTLQKWTHFLTKLVTKMPPFRNNAENRTFRTSVAPRYKKLRLDGTSSRLTSEALACD